MAIGGGGLDGPTLADDRSIADRVVHGPLAVDQGLAKPGPSARVLRVDPDPPQVLRPGVHGPFRRSARSHGATHWTVPRGCLWRARPIPRDGRRGFRLYVGGRERLHRLGPRGLRLA